MPDGISVAVLGTGIMGAAMARNLCRAGLDVRVWNRTRAKAEPLATEGARVTDSPREAVEGADVRPDDALRRRTSRVRRPCAPPHPGCVRARCGSSAPPPGSAESNPLAELGREYQLTFVDAPVLGTRQPAEAGQLLVLAVRSFRRAGRPDARPGRGRRPYRLGRRGARRGHPAQTRLQQLGAVRHQRDRRGAGARRRSRCRSAELPRRRRGRLPRHGISADQGGGHPVGGLHSELLGRAPRRRTPGSSSRRANGPAYGSTWRLRERSASGAPAEQGHGAEDMAASYFASFPDADGQPGRR